MWIIELTYRPLEGLDPLRTLLLAACAAQPCALSLLAEIFCLPVASLTRELERLERFGLVSRRSGDRWEASEQGRMAVAVWEAFERKPSTRVDAASGEWPLGPGEFSIPAQVASGEDVGLVLEDREQFDEQDAREFLASLPDRGNEEDASQCRRRQVAEGVLTYAWLRRQGAVVAAAAARQPAAFLCSVRAAQ